MSIILCKQEFKSKTKVYDFVRQKLISFDPNDPLWPELLKRHPNHVEKVGCGIDFFFVTQNKVNTKALQLNIQRIDGSIIDLSWRNCVDGKVKTQKQMLYDAMRLAISDQTQSFKAGAVFEDRFQCQICGCHVDKTHLAHVDHLISFKSIVEVFLKDKVAPCEFTDCRISHAAKFKDSDRQFEREWQEFHSVHASLRILCAKCNLSRSK